MNNLKRLKKLVLANKETRRLYRMMQFLAIFMVISCTIIVVIAKWIEHDQNQKREKLFGSWDEVFLDVPAEDLNYFKQNAFLEQISIQSIQEKVFLEGDKRVVIGSCDDNFLEMGNIELLEGRMPEKENEVAVEEEYLEIVGVSKIGDVISNPKITSLNGYKVVGVISNYSQRWKQINSDIKYINCFVSNMSKDKDINIIVKNNEWGDYDQEINMLNYKRNIQRLKINTSSDILLTIFMFLLIELVILIIIAINMKNEFHWKIVKKDGILRKKKIYINLIKSIEVISVVIATFLFYKVYINLYLGDLSFSNQKIKNFLIESSLNENEITYLVILKEGCFTKINTLFNTLEIVKNLRQMIMVFIMIIIAFSLKLYRHLFINDTSQIQLHRYFWGNSIPIHCKNENILELMTILTELALISLDIIINYRWIMIQILIFTILQYCIVCSILFNISKMVFRRKMIKHIEKNLEIRA